MLKRKVKQNITSSNIFLLLLLIVFSNNILSQEKCQFEIIDTLYCDTAFVYTIYENNKLVQYIDFKSNKVLDSTTLYNFIQQQKFGIYLSSIKLNVFILKSNRYLWRETGRENEYDMIDVYKFTNYRVRKIINKNGYIKYTLSVTEMLDMGFYINDNLNSNECLNAYSVLSNVIELVKSPMDADHPPK
jgi:hypothetical protein